MAPKKTIAVTLEADKVTKGAVRFTEANSKSDYPLNVYLRKDEHLSKLGMENAQEGDRLKLTVAVI